VKILSLFVASLFLCSLAVPQGRPGPPGITQGDQTVEQGDKNVPPPLYQRSRIDPAKLKRDADELASLAQTIPPGIEQTTKGVLPKDLVDRLKRIEKLAKQLRSQISE